MTGGPDGKCTRFLVERFWPAYCVMIFGITIPLRLSLHRSINGQWRLSGKPDEMVGSKLAMDWHNRRVKLGEGLERVLGCPWSLLYRPFLSITRHGVRRDNLVSTLCLTEE